MNKTRNVKLWFAIPRTTFMSQLQVLSHMKAVLSAADGLYPVFVSIKWKKKIKSKNFLFRTYSKYLTGTKVMLEISKSVMVRLMNLSAWMMDESPWRNLATKQFVMLGGISRLCQILSINYKVIKICKHKLFLATSIKVAISCQFIVNK